jgi:CHAT domain-containing protein
MNRKCSQIKVRFAIVFAEVQGCRGEKILTLAAGFLCSGARSVISSLWMVTDASTALLSLLYYQGRLTGLNRPRALQQAQQQLRNLSNGDWEEVKQKRDRALDLKKQAQGSKKYDFYKREYQFWWGVSYLMEQVLTQPRSLPLSHPFYWAAFTCQGLA